MSFKISRASYAAHYGPTVGRPRPPGRYRAVIEIEKDYTHPATRWSSAAAR